jgi:hypothetical protein
VNWKRRVLLLSAGQVLLAQLTGRFSLAALNTPKGHQFGDVKHVHTPPSIAYRSVFLSVAQTHDATTITITTNHDLFSRQPFPTSSAGSMLCVHHKDCMVARGMPSNTGEGRGTASNNSLLAVNVSIGIDCHLLFVNESDMKCMNQ